MLQNIQIMDIIQHQTQIFVFLICVESDKSLR